MSELQSPRGDPASLERAMRSAFFSLFSIPNPATPDVPVEATLRFPWSLLQRIPGFPQLLAAVEVNEGPLRFRAVTGEESCQLLATNQVGHEVATVHIRWTPIPWDYPANPDTRPPQTILNPFVEQRFEMLDGEFRFADERGSGFHGFGSGRTFPNFPRGLSLQIGAVIDILEGFGELAGYQGLVVVNGVITPPNELDLSLLVRVLDPDGDFLTTGPLPPLGGSPSPDTTATFMMFQGDPDPARPPVVRRGPDGVEGLEIAQVLRPVDLDFAPVPGRGLESRVVPGPAVGSARATLHFPVADGVPVPAWTSGGRFHFFDGSGREIGCVEADLVEGRGLPTTVTGVPGGLYRMGGFGPITGGSGQFAGARGMLSTNAVFSLAPFAASHVWVFRFVDPDQRLRPLQGAPA